jgi:hypothetical protein
VFNMVLRMFLRVIAQSLQANCPGAANADKATLHIGAIAFTHRFGSSLSEPVHFNAIEAPVRGVAHAPLSLRAYATKPLPF